MGDFVKGNRFDGFSRELVRHLKLHRYVDTYTSRNSFFQHSRRTLDPRFRYARSVLVDVFYDHILACRWGDFHSLPLADFARQVYAGLEACFDELSPDLQRQLPRMREYDWLTSYQYPEAVGRVLLRLEERIQHKFPLAEGFLELDRCRSVLESDFNYFMSDAEDVVRHWKVNH